MKFFIILLTIFLVQCENKEPKSYDFTLEDIEEKFVFYASVAEPMEAYTQRCDLLTFKGLWDAYGLKTNIYDHEYEAGQWHRDVKLCFPDDSRSEISNEGIMGAMHAMVARKDFDRLKDLWDFLEANDWIAGEGPKEYTRVVHLKPLMREILKENDMLLSKTSVFRLAAEDADSVGYRGNVLADYIFLHGVSLGYIESWHLSLLKELVKDVPQSPFYQAMVGCYEWTDNYQTALNLLGDEELFPSDRLPEKSNEMLWDWSDAPQLPLFAMTKRVLEHCHE